MNNQENNDKQDFTPRDIIDNKQYRAILILVFYAIFFIGIIISARSNFNKNKSKTENKTENKTEEKTTKKDNLNGFYTSKNANFEYKYTLVIEDKTMHTKVYEGKKYKDKDSYTLTEDGKVKTYTSDEEYTFEKKDGQTILSENTYYLINYFNPDVISSIVKKSVYVDNNNYTINNRELGKLLKSSVSMADVKENSIKLYYTQDKITKIEINYSNYANTLDNKVKSAKLTLEYKSFDSVEDFDIKN